MKSFNTLPLALLLITSIRAASQSVPITEYMYDENGNMKGDANKEIASIHYNVLNLHDTITYISGYNVINTYSAAGHKLRETLLSPEATTEQRTDYARNFRFENDTLQSIQHPEGRVIPKLPGNLASDWEYQYYVTDHLGNVRMTITSQTDTMQYQATMENEKAVDEENFFQGIDQHRSPFITANHTPKGNEAARLPNNTEKGISASFTVKRGDVIYAQVYTYHEGPVGDNPQAGSTTNFYQSGKLFADQIKDKKTVQIGAMEGNSAEDFTVFVGLDVTEAVQKNKDIYLVVIDVDRFSNFGISNLTGHELEAHVNIDQQVKGLVKPNGKIDLEVDGKKMEMGMEDVQHLLFGSPGVRLNGGDAVIINKGTSAERLNDQLSQLWLDMAKQLLPYGHLLF